MLFLEGYHIKEQLYESNNSQVYRGIRVADGQPVILKLLQGEYPTPKQLSNYRREYEITRKMTSPGVVQVYDLLKYRNSLVMVLEDFGGQSLKQLGVAGQLTLGEVLKLAIPLSEILGQIHQAQVMHKDINLANIVLNPATHILKIIDFGLATQLPREYLTFLNPQGLEGTLAYISPEQTGRMNRGIDYRTDLYSLGVTLYELLTGQLPFTEADSLALVHAHIAKTPPSPLDLRMKAEKLTSTSALLTTPYALMSHLIMKLLAKNAEDRYQSALGLKYDLEQIQELGIRSQELGIRNQELGIRSQELGIRSQELGIRSQELEGRDSQFLTPDSRFQLGAQDFSGRFQIPQKLYGREEEVEHLLAGFRRVVEGGASELMLVSGYSGIGKTALVQEVYKPITAKQGYFVSGKFDQYQRNVPYSSLVQAFQRLMQHLLTETEAQIAAWRSKLLQALGANGQVIAQVIPDVALIMGEQPPLPELGPTETQNRFKLVLQQFIKVFAQTDHPLVLFLDDLQWADEASLNLLQLILTVQESPCLYIIGAYRDNEVGAGHPLLLTLGEIEKAGVMVTRLNLLPLSSAHVQVLIADTVQQTEVESLASLVLEKTGGNPFFVNEFLKALYEQGLLRFVEANRRWEWDIAEIRQLGLTDNVVELMAGKLQQLTLETQRTLQFAACIGNQFELSHLSVVLEQTPQNVAQTLWAGVEVGLIIPLDDGYKFVGHEGKEATYKFAHDRIQQAAYSSITEAERVAWHWRIGQLLLQQLSEQARAERLFDIVNQLNQGRVWATTSEERHQLAELNVAAGHKAKQSIAYHSAKAYFEVALALLPESCWETMPSLTFEVYRALGETEFLLSHHDLANRLLAAALAHAQTPLDIATIQFIKISQLTGLGQYAEATETAVEVLALFGLKMPRLSETALIQQATEAEIALYRQNMAERTIESLADLPDMTDENMLLCWRTIGMTVPALVIALPHLLPLYTIKAVNIAITYGLSEAMPINFVFLGSVQMVVFNDFGATYRFSKLAVTLHEERFPDLSLRSKVYHMHAFFCLLGEHISVGLKYQRLCYRVGIETGDLVFAAYAATGVLRLLSSLSLVEVLSEAEAISPFLHQMNNIPMLSLTKLAVSTVYALQGRTFQPGQLDNELFSAMDYWNMFQAVPVLASYLRRAEIQVYVTLEQYEAAWPIAQERVNWIANQADALVWSDYSFYAGVMAVALAKDTVRQSDCLDMVQACLRDLEKLAHHCPANFAHPYFILQAEKAKLEGHIPEAMRFYKEGIASARANGFWQHEAIGSELAGRFYVELGFAEFAELYFRQAHYAYQHWGATAKVNQLEQQYPFLTQRSHHIEGTASTTSQTLDQSSSGTIAWGKFGPQNLDLETIMKAAQAISGEINLSSLLEKMIQIVVENAGAQRGLLVLKSLEEWRVEAKLETSPLEIQVLQGIPMEAVGGQSERPELSVSMTQYVIRTQKALVLNDARRDERFGQLAYIRLRQPQSVLCLPLVSQGEVRGVLYLENNLSVGVFTPERVQILQLLAAQMAISLDNARLYDQLEQLVAARTRELQQALDHLKMTQNQLVESEKMAALGGLVAGVAHEINTPVGIAVTSASFLEDKTQLVAEIYAQGRLGKVALEAYFRGAIQSSRLILNNLEKASELVRSFKQVAVDQANLEKRHFKVKEYLAEIIMSLKPQLKTQELEVELQGDDEVSLNSYPGAFSQIITNLMMNSLRHGYDPGMKGVLRLLVSYQGSQVEVRYSDDGKGMSEEVLKRIYEPFFTTARHAGGTGLGMHIVYNLVTQKMGGHIRCESQPGQGTLFILLFPVT